MGNIGGDNNDEEWRGRVSGLSNSMGLEDALLVLMYHSVRVDIGMAE
jgi:hypothetical protein